MDCIFIFFYLYLELCKRDLFHNGYSKSGACSMTNFYEIQFKGVNGREKGHVTEQDVCYTHYMTWRSRSSQSFYPAARKLNVLLWCLKSQVTVLYSSAGQKRAKQWQMFRGFAIT